MGNSKINPVTEDRLRSRMQEIVDMADFVAMAILRRTQPASDEISQREAFRTYGYGWIKLMSDRGLLESKRKGRARNSPIVYSRFQIEALREAERKPAI